MAVDRSVTVRLKIDNSDFIRGLGEASLAARALEKQLAGTTGRFDKAMGRSTDNLDHFGDHVDDTSGKVLFLGKGVGDTSSGLHTFGEEATGASKATDRLTTSVKKTGAAFKSTDRDSKGFFAGLNTGNDRMSFLVQTSLALGPALIPVFAAAVPVVTGFGAALGFAATAAGVGALAFSGVGDVLKKLNDFQLDPTEARLNTLRVAMEKLGSAGVGFVNFLQDLRPELQALQTAAQEGLLPGVEEGITAVMTQLPLLKQVVESIASVSGDIAARTGEAFTSPFWTDFFEFLRDDAQGILTDFASAIGHLVEGLSALVMAFQPLSEDFVSGFDDMARSFSAWAQGLDQTQGFTDFVAYIREAGPEFLDVISATGDALVALGAAGGDVGLASLEVLQRLLEGLAAVLSSPIGAPLLAVAAGLSAISRAVALARIASLTTLFGGLTTLLGPKGVLASVGASAKVFGGLTVASAGISALGTAARTATGPLIGLGLAFTDLDDDLGISNTATLAAFGSALGPWGLAIGAIAGATMDLARANDSLDDALKQAQLAFADTTGIDAQEEAIARVQERVDDLHFKEERLKQFNQEADFLGFSPGVGVLDGVIEKFFGQPADEAEDDLVVMREKTELWQQSLSDLVNVVQGNGGVFEDFTNDTKSMAEALVQVQPAMDALGLDIDNLLNAQTTGNVFSDFLGKIQWDTAVAGIRAWTQEQDTAAGRTRTVAAAIADLDNEFLTTAASAATLSEALDALLNPQLDLQAATDAWAAGLDHLEENLAKNSRALFGQTDAARKNREVLRGQINLMKDQLTLEAEAGVSSRKFLADLEARRKKLFDTFVAAGFAKDELRAMLKVIGLTPHQIQILVDLNKEAFDRKHRDVVHDSEILEDLDPVIQVDAETHAAQTAIDSILNSLRALAGPFTATVNVSRNISTSNIRTGGTQRDADGGEIRGPGGPRSDIIPILASNGEFIVNAQAAQANLDLLRRINATRFADGGPVGFAAGGQVLSPGDLSRRAFHQDDPRTILELVRALKELREEAKDVTEAEEDVAAAREASKEAARQLRQVEDTSSQKYKDRARAQKAADKDLEQAEKELSKQREELSKATAKWKDIQAQLIEQAKAVQASILGAGSIFGGEGTSVSIGGILAKMREAAKDGREFNRNIAKIRALGIPESYVQQLLEAAGTPEGNAAAENLANASKRQVEQLQRASRHLANVAQASGRAATQGGGGGGGDINVRFTGPITTTDVTNLDRKLAQRIRRAVRVATGG